MANPVAFLDGAEDGKRSPQKTGGPLEISLGDRLSDCRGADGGTVNGYRGDRERLVPVIPGELLDQRHIALALVSKTKPLPNADFL